MASVMLATSSSTPVHASTPGPRRPPEVTPAVGTVLRHAKLATMPEWVAAAGELAERHDLAAALLERHGAPQGLRPTPPSRRFSSLARSIAFQQLSTRAASTIWARVQDVVGEVSPEALLDLRADDLRSAGLSRAKVAAMRDLALRSLEGSLDLQTIARRDDHGVVAHLCQVKGIGEWTAQMFLIFDLGRTDVWPTGDLGVRSGWAKATGAPSALSPHDFGSVGRPFSPHRSVVAWWCWREVDSTGVWP
jgi:3-methyladenine DNA glycosylase/8-oxoguanine DNA glycosylase